MPPHPPADGVLLHSSAADAHESRRPAARQLTLTNRFAAETVLRLKILSRSMATADLGLAGADGAGDVTRGGKIRARLLLQEYVAEL